MADRAVVIVAGGSGSRMKSDIPKQFLPLANKPVLVHTLEKFYHFDPTIEIILVLPEQQILRWKEIIRSHTVPSHRIVSGGETRFHSVKSGLSLIENEKYVAIHDGVRPLVSESTISRCFAEATSHPAVIPVIDIPDSIRVLEDQTNNRPMDRNLVRMVQTPQVFQTEVILKSFEQPYVPEFTDDASVVEKAGYSITLVEGNRENIKITTSSDLLIATALTQF